MPIEFNQDQHPATTAAALLATRYGSPAAYHGTKHIAQAFRDYRDASKIPTTYYQTGDASGSLPYFKDVGRDDLGKNLQFGDVLLYRYGIDDTVADVGSVDGKLQSYMVPNPVRQHARVAITIPGGRFSFKERADNPWKAFRRAAREADPDDLVAGLLHLTGDPRQVHMTKSPAALDLIREFAEGGFGRRVSQEKSFVKGLDKLLNTAIRRPRVPFGPASDDALRSILASPVMRRSSIGGLLDESPHGSRYLELWRPKTPLSEAERLRMIDNYLDNNSIFNPDLVSSAMLKNLLGISPKSGPVPTCSGGVCNTYVGVRKLPKGINASPNDIALSKDFELVKRYIKAPSELPESLAKLVSSPKKMLAHSIRGSLPGTLLGVGVAGLGLTGLLNSFKLSTKPKPGSSSSSSYGDLIKKIVSEIKVSK